MTRWTGFDLASGADDTIEVRVTAKAIYVRPIYARRVQLALDRAGKRWARRFAARLDAEKKTKRADPRLRDLEEQARRTHQKLLILDGPDTFAAALRKAGEVEPRNPDDPDDE